MSFSFLDNLDVDEVDPEDTSIREVPETPIKRQSGLPQEGTKKQKKGGDFDNSLPQKEFLEKPHAEKNFDAENSTSSPGLRRSKRIAKKKDVDADDGGRSTEEAKQNRRTRAARKAGKSELPKKDNSLSYMKTPPKSEASIPAVGQKSKSPTGHSTPPHDLKKLPTTPGPVHNVSLLKVALGNAALKHSTPLNHQQMSHHVETQKFGLTRKSEQPVVPNEPTLDKATRVPVKSRMGRADKKGKHAIVTFKETEPKVSAEDPVKEAKSEKRIITPTGAIKQSLAKDPVKEDESKKRNMTMTGATKRSLAKDSVTHTQPVPAKLARQRSTITISSNNHTRIPMKNVDSNQDDVKEKSTEPRTQTVKKVVIIPKVGSKPLAAKPVKFTTKKDPSPEKPSEARDARKSLKSIVKRSTLGLNKAKVKARVTMAVAEMVEKPVKREVRAFAPRKSCKMVDQYKHVQSKVAQLIHGPSTITSAPKIRDTKSAVVKTNGEIKAAKKPLHDKPFVVVGRVRPDKVFETSTSTGSATAALAKNSVGQTPPRKSRAGDNLQVMRATKSLVPSNLAAGKPPKLDTMNARQRRTTRKPV